MGGVLARLGDELAERERLLAVAVEERDAESEALERRAQELTECLAALECDEVELGERKRKLERREARLRSKEKKIAARVHELQQPEAEPEGTHAALERHVEHDTAARLQRNRDSSRGTEGMSSGLELARGRDGRWNHAAISRTVRACAGSFPHRGVEWEAFLRELGSYVDSNGFLPPRFDALVEEVFGELFDRTSLD